jgi:hypothetical protein
VFLLLFGLLFCRTSAITSAPWFISLNEGHRAIPSNFFAALFSSFQRLNHRFIGHAHDFAPPSSIPVSSNRPPWMTLKMITLAPMILKMVR